MSLYKSFPDFHQVVPIKINFFFRYSFLKQDVLTTDVHLFKLYFMKLVYNFAYIHTEIIVHLYL